MWKLNFKSNGSLGCVEETKCLVLVIQTVFLTVKTGPCVNSIESRRNRSQNIRCMLRKVSASMGFMCWWAPRVNPQSNIYIYNNAIHMAYNTMSIIYFPSIFHIFSPTKTKLRNQCTADVKSLPKNSRYHMPIRIEILLPINN